MNALAKPNQTQDSTMDAQPFDFGVSFDKPKVTEQEEVEEVEAEPTFSMEEVEAAKQKAFDEGQAAANEIAQNCFESKITEALEKIAIEIGVLEDEQQRLHRSTQALASELVRRIGERLLPQTAAVHGFEEIEHALEQCLDLINENVRVTIRVHTDCAAEIEKRFQSMLGSHKCQADITIVGDEKMGPADCAIMWGDGGAERDFDSLWGTIDATLSKFEKNITKNPHKSEIDQSEDHLGAELEHNKLDNKITETKPAGT
ncbi:MAG: FliH/SctL family protein [Pseudomonadota bacterium]|nr:FliH/SctL family protein [Pseudomonadota bacterium]